MEHGLTQQRRTRARTSELAVAIAAARRIRRNLVRHRGETDLGGDCGLASLLLADELGSPDSLRHARATVVAHDVCNPIEHVFNVVGDHIIDITATQFNDLDAGEPAVFGVLIATSPRVYHAPVIGRGAETVAYLAEAGWYDDQSHRRLAAVLRRLGGHL